MSRPQSPLPPLLSVHVITVSFLQRNANLAFLFFRVPRSCIKFAFPPARVPKMPGTWECETRNARPSLHFKQYCATSLILRLPCRTRMLSGGDGGWTWMSGKGVAPPRNRIDLSIRLLQGANPFREIIRSRGPLIYCTRAKYTRGRGSLWTRSSLRDSDWTSSSSSDAPPPPPAAARQGVPQRRPFIRTGVTKVA